MKLCNLLPYKSLLSNTELEYTHSGSLIIFSLFRKMGSFNLDIFSVCANIITINQILHRWILCFISICFCSGLQKLPVYIASSSRFGGWYGSSENQHQNSQQQIQRGKIYHEGIFFIVKYTKEVKKHKITWIFYFLIDREISLEYCMIEIDDGNFITERQNVKFVIYLVIGCAFDLLMLW